MKIDYLDVGSKAIIVYGSLNIALAVLVPLLGHFLFPKPFVFAREDEVFTNTSWSLVLATRERLGLWILFQADTVRGMMLGLGVLTIAVAMKGLNKGEKWAFFSVLLSGIAGGSPFWAFTGLYFQNGLYEGVSSISLGFWLTLIIYVPWAVGLLLSGLGIRKETGSLGAKQV